MTRDLTPEGQKLLDTILSYANLSVEPGDQDGPPNNVNKKGRWQLEAERLRLEMTKMMINSIMVVEDCNEIIKQITTADGYINCDAKVAKTLHTNLVSRIQKILSGQPAFDDESHLTLNAERILKSMK
jgi:hypothetical protein